MFSTVAGVPPLYSLENWVLSGCLMESASDGHVHNQTQKFFGFCLFTSMGTLQHEQGDTQDVWHYEHDKYHSSGNLQGPHRHHTTVQQQTLCTLPPNTLDQPGDQSTPVLHSFPHPAVLGEALHHHNTNPPEPTLAATIDWELLIKDNVKKNNNNDNNK